MTFPKFHYVSYRLSSIPPWQAVKEGWTEKREDYRQNDLNGKINVDTFNEYDVYKIRLW